MDGPSPTKWEDGEATLFGLMTAGFPNLFLMPCPGHQAVVTVNYTLLTEVAAEHIAATVAATRSARRRASSTSPRKPRRTGSDRSSPPTPPRPPPRRRVACRVPRGHECSSTTTGNMVILEPHAGSYGGGFGDYFGYRDLLAQWRETGDFAGLKLERLASS